MKKLREFIIEKTIFLSGIASILFVLLIFLFLLLNGLSLFKTVNFKDFLLGENWSPVCEPPSFGILPLILGSLFVTLTAAIISIPIGIGSAIYIAEVAPLKIKEFLKAMVETLAAIPSIVLGFIGMVTLVPWIKRIFNLPTGLTALSGAILLSFMALPTIISITEDALYAVPKAYKEAAFAIGATHWQAIHRVILPAAYPGIFAAVMLGMGRVIGETMAVMMVTGNAPLIPKSLLVPVRTLTATIAAEMGETVAGSEHYFSLFAIGIILFIISFIINITAEFFLHRE
ncbi:MAG: phosphate ABC transporter permease subunit PstC [Candidatus Omnitrophica bacterium]|nr:phosphate ABC transporter permease subunit PstC [Candidatus Omnitrophota bacterium]MCM8793773.1 phosphate ABC transporter permease subunit PstC [Candidatus Omnitrophota bacterium]